MKKILMLMIAGSFLASIPGCKCKHDHIIDSFHSKERIDSSLLEPAPKHRLNDELRVGTARPMEAIGAAKIREDVKGAAPAEVRKERLEVRSEASNRLNDDMRVGTARPAEKIAVEREEEVKIAAPEVRKQERTEVKEDSSNRLNDDMRVGTARPTEKIAVNREEESQQSKVVERAAPVAQRKSGQDEKSFLGKWSPKEVSKRISNRRRVQREKKRAAEVRPEQRRVVKEVRRESRKDRVIQGRHYILRSEEKLVRTIEPKGLLPRPMGAEVIRAK